MSILIDNDRANARNLRSPRLRPVVESLVGQIREGRLRVGDRLPTVRDLATQYAVSFSSARSAVSHLERMGLVQCIQGSGTYVRNQQQGEVSNATAYLFLDARAHVLGELAHHLADRLQDARVLPIHARYLGAGVENIDHLINRWQQEPPRAIVVQGVITEKFEKTIRGSCPASTRVIGTFRHPQFCPIGWHSVNPDYRAAYRMATERLLAQGHKRIGLLIKPRRLNPAWPNTSRKAYMWHTEQILAVGETLRDAGVAHGLTIHYNVPVGGDPSGIPTDEENLARMTRWLEQPDRPTAVVGDDFRLIGLKLAARRAGLQIGRDLALIGVGSGALAEAAEFPLVSLRYDLIARHLVELITRSNDPADQAARHILVPPTFSNAT